MLDDDEKYRYVRCDEDIQEVRVLPSIWRLVEAILVTIFCCMPFGIPAIVYAVLANERAVAGNVQGAIQAASKAKAWVSASLFAWLLGILASVLFAHFMGFTKSAQ
jgi:hypothetical protein